MSSAASFSERWASDNLTRDAPPKELAILDLFLSTCNGDEEEAGKRARRYYTARGAGGLTDLWHGRTPDSEDILKSCQDAYIVPLKCRSVGGRRMTLVRLPAPTALDRPLSAQALLSRWLMILDIRLREDPTPGEEVVFIDVSDLQPGHLKNHFKGKYWKNFVWCMKHAYPTKFSEVHVINTHRLKTMSLLLLHIGLYPWRRKVVRIHPNAEQINTAMSFDYFPVDGLPYEYGGKAGAMKDLNDEWTKKVLSNAKWLQSEERKYYETELTPIYKQHSNHSRVSIPGHRSGNYDVHNFGLAHAQSCHSLCDEPVYGQYRICDREYYI